MPIRAVFFDLDDTLCDAIGSRPQRARKALEAFCHRHPEYDLEQLLPKVLEPHPTIDRDIRGLRSVFAELGVEESEGARAAYACYATYFDPLHLFDGVPETLERLSQRYGLGVISNGDEAVQRGKLRHCGLERHLRWTLISEEVGIRKPDPRIFRQALSLAGVAPHEAAFVGDRLDTDVGGAQAAGMRAVWFNPSAALRTGHWGGRLEDASPQPDAVIERFSQLPKVLEEL